ncbi:16058_t:CDS:2, partial [Dentiscutata heterogama]
DRVNESSQDDKKIEINDPSEYSLKSIDMGLEIGDQLLESLKKICPTLYGMCEECYQPNTDESWKWYYEHTAPASEISVNIKEIGNGSENSFVTNTSEINRLNYETHPQAFYISRPIDTQEIAAVLNLN